MIETTLREIGLTEGEIKVYTALLDIGTTTTGKLIKTSKISASKVYQILERLSQKGLVIHVIKQKTKYFQATDPQRLLDYLEEKDKVLRAQKQNIEKILPTLMQKQQQNTEHEAEMYKGIGGVKNMLYSIVDDLQKGDEYCVLGAGYGFESDEHIVVMLKEYHEHRAQKGIKAKLLFNFEAFPLAQNMRLRLCDLRVMPQDMSTNTQIMIFKNKIFIILWKKDPLGFIIKDRELRDSFKKYFDVLWERKVDILRGFQGIQRVCDLVVKTKKDLYLLGANGLLYTQRPEYFEAFEKKRLAASIQRFHLSISETRGLDFNTLPKTQVKYLPKEFSSPLVIWIFGEYVANILWEKEELVFLMKNKKIAEDYRKYFRFLWEQQTHTYYGYDGLQEIFDDALQYPEILFIGGGGYIAARMPEYWQKYNAQRIQKKQWWRVLARQKVEHTKIFKEPYFEKKTLTATQSSPNVIWIYGDKVANVLWIKEPIAFVIENKDVAQNYREYFKYLWKVSK